MFPKKAILQVADTGPLESLIEMFSAIGIECLLPNAGLRDELRRIGCDTVLDIQSLVDGMGYEWPTPLPYAGGIEMRSPDILYVDVKGHRNGPKVWDRWPNLKGRVLWYRINGGRPEHVINARGDHGNEVNPPCPVLTPNQWYRDPWLGRPSDDPPDWCGADGRAYCCWPPFVRFKEYADRLHYTRGEDYDRPVCLVHNLPGWGYGALVDPVRRLGVRMFGRGSPDGLVSHKEVRGYLRSAVATVHLKSSDAPGYALYESLAAACPVICTRRLIWRCWMQELLIPGETCLVFDRETHAGLTEEDVRDCTDEVAACLHRLRDPKINRLIGEAGREHLLKVMWSKEREEDVTSLRDFMGRHFG